MNIEVLCLAFVSVEPYREICNLNLLLESQGEKKRQSTGPGMMRGPVWGGPQAAGERHSSRSVANTADGGLFSQPCREPKRDCQNTFVKPKFGRHSYPSQGQHMSWLRETTARALPACPPSASTVSPPDRRAQEPRDLHTAFNMGKGKGAPDPTLPSEAQAPLDHCSGTSTDAPPPPLLCRSEPADV